MTIWVRHSDRRNGVGTTIINAVEHAYRRPRFELGWLGPFLPDGEAFVRYLVGDTYYRANVDAAITLDENGLPANPADFIRQLSTLLLD
jgi:hypothetical protein